MASCRTHTADVWIWSEVLFEYDTMEVTRRTNQGRVFLVFGQQQLNWEMEANRISTMEADVFGI